MIGLNFLCLPSFTVSLSIYLSVDFIFGESKNGPKRPDKKCVQINSIRVAHCFDELDFYGLVSKERSNRNLPCVESDISLRPDKARSNKMEQ